MFCLDPQSGLSGFSELGTQRGGSVRIQHRPPKHPLAAAGGATVAGSVQTSRFPKLDECAHFHYEVVDLGPLTVFSFSIIHPFIYSCLFIYIFKINFSFIQ